MAKTSTKAENGKAAEPKKEAVEEMIRESREKAEVKRETAGEAMDGGQESIPSKYDVRFVIFPNEGAIKGVCSVTINNEFCVKNIRLVEGSNGLFVAMPSYKSGEEYKDIFFPVTKEARSSIQEAVVKEYDLQMQIHRSDATFTGTRVQQEAPQGLPANVIQ